MSQENPDLLQGSDTISDVQQKAALTTDVTSVAREEQKTGLEVKIPKPEELYSKAIASFVRHMKHLNDLINLRNGGSYKISRKGMNRIINSILQLPMDGLPVNLQGEDEKAAFALGQRIIADRYLITHHHIIEEKKRLQKEREEAIVSRNAEEKMEKKADE